MPAVPPSMEGQEEEVGPQLARVPMALAECQCEKWEELQQKGQEQRRDSGAVGLTEISESKD